MLVKCAAALLQQVEAHVVELRDYPAPVFNPDVLRSEGVPETMQLLHKEFVKAKGFIISFPEYNSSITPVFKNTIDWISRIQRPIFQDKVALLMSTSSGGRGGRTNLEHVAKLMPRWGASVTGIFSLPNFNESIDREALTVIHESERKELTDLVARFEKDVA